jgi:large subunit ribosomal protein L13
MSYTAGTYSAKPSEVTRAWHVVDAKGMVLGRLAAEIAKILRGKHKAYYTPHIDCGDSVVVINAAQIKLTGKKYTDRKFYWHTGYMGGLKERTMKEILTGRFPERVVKKAVQRMMPKDSPLSYKQFNNLYVYADENHLHQPQQPQALDIAAQNSKNKR